MPLPLVYAMFTSLLFLTVFLAGIVRGYTGFGFSAIVILVITLRYPVAQAVPAVLLTDFLACLPLYVSSSRGASRQALLTLLPATCIGIPIGFLVLWVLDDAWLKLLVPTVILIMALLPKLRGTIARQLLNSSWLAGVMSGWTTSAVSSGGAPVIIFIRYSALSLSVQRDTLIIYFALATALTLVVSGVVHQQLPQLPEFPVVLTVTAFLGVWIGKQAFTSYKTPWVNHIAYYLLLSLSIGSLLSAIFLLFRKGIIL